MMAEVSAGSEADSAEADMANNVVAAGALVGCLTAARLRCFLILGRQRHSLGKSQSSSQFLDLGMDTA